MSPLTLAPLPRWRDLLSVIFKRSADDNTLASPWGRKDDITFLFSRSAWSLLAIACWNKKLFNKQNINVWIPDFFCNESLIPLREMGFSLIFYPVTTEMNPNFFACELLANKHPPNIFLLTHYFGRPVTSDLANTFCKKYGSWLIEDAAHILRPIPGVGEMGDCVIYSPHKHLPIPDGAVLVVRRNGPGQLTENKRAMAILHHVRSDIFSQKFNVNYHAYLWLFKRIVQTLGLHVNLSKKIFRATILEGNIKALGHPKMHNISKCILTNLFTKLDSVATRREQNAKNISNVMTLAINIPKFSPYIIKETPYLACFFSKKILDAEIIFNFFKKCNLPISTWPDLPPEVINSLDTHKIAIELRSNRFYLPVHQSLSEFKLFKCGKNILKNSTLQWHVKDLSYDEWKKHWENCPETNLLQSWNYGEAKKNTDGWRIQHLLIEDHLEHPVAIAQVLTKAWPIFGGIARLNRGPLLLANHLNDDEVSLKLAALSVLLEEMSHRHLWFFQIAPEIKDSQFAHNTLRALGLRLQSIDAWASGLIDLNLTEDVLYNNLNRRWKRALRKSLDGGVIIENEELTFARLDDVLKSYKNLQVSNKFKGIDEVLVKEMFIRQSNQWTMNLFVAKKINENGFYNDIGYRLCIYQGYTALDFIVSTNNEGVAMEASSSLYWHAILHAKQSGCRWFDIGGLNKSTPKGIAEFKSGLNANPYRLVGEWRKWF